MEDVAVSMLAWFKERDMQSPEAVHVLLRDAIVRNLVVAWTRIPVSFKLPRGKPPDDERLRWDWLWKGCSFDRERLASCLCLDRSKCHRLMDRAILFRMIYPDGTASRNAIDLIRQEIRKAIPQPKGKPSSSGKQDPQAPSQSTDQSKP